MRKHIYHACISCGKVRLVQTRNGKTRSLMCKSCSKTGVRHPQYGKIGKESANWKGGETTDKRGYIFIYNLEHPRADSKGYVKRAIIVLESKLGRPLLDGCDAHHLNEIKGDDRPDNLEERKHSTHARQHSYMKPRNNNGQFYDDRVVTMRTK